MITTFKFPSYYDFRRRLGKANAVCAASESANLHLLKSLGDHSLCFESIYKDYGIKVDAVTSFEFMNDVNLLHVLAAISSIEHGFKRMFNEHPQKDRFKQRANTNLIENAFAGIKDDEVVFSVDIFTYYNKVRNCYMHGEKLSKYPDNYDELRECRLECYSNLDAPNQFGSFCFDDVILLNRVAIRLAELFCVLHRPTDEEVKSMVMSIAKGLKPALINSCNDDRLFKFLTTVSRTKCGLSEKESRPIIETLVYELREG